MATEVDLSIYDKVSTLSVVDVTPMADTGGDCGQQQAKQSSSSLSLHDGKKPLDNSDLPHLQQDS